MGFDCDDFGEKEGKKKIFNENNNNNNKTKFPVHDLRYVYISMSIFFTNFSEQ